MAKNSTVTVLSTDCTHVIPGLLELPAGIPTIIPATDLDRVLALPGVIQINIPQPVPSED